MGESCVQYYLISTEFVGLHREHVGYLFLLLLPATTIANQLLRRVLVYLRHPGGDNRRACLDCIYIVGYELQHIRWHSKLRT